MISQRKLEKLCCVRFLVFFVAVIAFMSFSLPLWSQNGTGNGQSAAQSERERLDSNALATLSVGLVIQSFGYIGAFADLLSKGVYEPEIVRSMLGETVQYLTNAQNVLHQYQNRSVSVSPGDRRYIGEVENILVLLIQEAESLSSFALSHSEEDLQNYRTSRDKALKLIDKLTKP
jgi:hypothetical protein